jgi:hypothetical protein
VHLGSAIFSLTFERRKPHALLYRDRSKQSTCSWSRTTRHCAEAQIAVIITSPATASSSLAHRAEPRTADMCSQHCRDSSRAPETAALVICAASKTARERPPPPNTQDFVYLRPHRPQLIQSTNPYSSTSGAIHGQP